MANQFSFFFGIELELLIGSRSKSHKSWKSLASEVSSKLKKAGIANHVNEGNDKSLENYEEWSVVQEVTVPSQPGKNLWGVELVSPIYDFTTPWEVHLSLIFKTLKSSFTLSSSSNTSTHIHLSTSPPLPPSYLGALAKSILYFEPAIDLLLPPARASSYWCQSNHDNTSLKSLTLPECFEYLDYCSDANDVARAMCSFPAKSAYGRANGYSEDFVHGVYKWDFSGLVDPSACLSSNPSPSGTLEFRQCPGSGSADEARTWLLLSLGFVAGAIDGEGTLDPDAPVAMEDLWWPISSGLQSLGMAGGDTRGVEKLFSGSKKAKGVRK
ncbi:putative Amidoligase enzyme-domain-containing protein [Seiridium unicorne]|uniref:Amidoligase enzyme-domain-containing protein n=1 Tax=Seiridium unicorne TaxID=138068 RepID=A0ABR2VA90_9PEZI